MFVLFQCSPLLRRAVPDMNMRPRPSTYPRLDDPTKLGTNPGRTYRFFTGNAVFPCETHLQPSAPVPVCCVSLSEPVQLWHLLQSNAHYSRVVSYGLSYVNFSYSHVVAATNEDRGTPEAVSLAMLPQLLSQQKHGFVPSTATATVDPGFSINVTNTTRSIHHVQSITFNPSRSIHHVQSINVTNTGDLDADDVVLGFLTPPQAGQGGAPLKTLVGFQRVHVPARCSRLVTLYPALTDFSLVSEAGVREAVPGDWTLSFGVAEGGGFAQRSLRAHL
jgi:hypothetical protein